MRDEPAASDVESLLRNADGAVRLSAANAAEVIDVMARIFGIDVDQTRNALSVLEGGRLRFEVVDSVIGFRAGELRARHYDRAASPLSLADCIALATAITLDEPLATADVPLANAARSEGVKVVALPNSRGERPTT